MYKFHRYIAIFISNFLSNKEYWYSDNIWDFSEYVKYAISPSLPFSFFWEARRNIFSQFTLNLWGHLSWEKDNFYWNWEDQTTTTTRFADPPNYIICMICTFILRYQFKLLRRYMYRRGQLYIQSHSTRFLKYLSVWLKYCN